MSQALYYPLFHLFFSYIYIYIYMRNISRIVDKSDTDNRFSNYIYSLFKKDFFRMMGFSKIQHWRKWINKNTGKKKKKLGVIRRGDRKERKGEIEIYVWVLAAGVIGCDYKHLGDCLGSEDGRGQFHHLSWE